MIDDLKDLKDLNKLEDAWPTGDESRLESNVIDFEELVNFSFDNFRAEYDFVNDFIYEF